jgi:hypothetical protein
MPARFAVLLALLALVTLGTSPAVAAPPGPGGPVIGCPNPAAPDDDGDGIPNGQDPDYVPPLDGTGKKWGSRAAMVGTMFWTRSFYSILSHSWMPIERWVARAGGWGPGDGTGNGGVGPGDGTGYGPGPRR